MTSPSWNPEWIWGIAVIVLGIAMAYGMMRARRRTPGEKQQTEAATRELYRQEDQKAKTAPK